MSRTKAILIAIDQLFNALAGGWPDESISSRAWRWDQAGVRHWPRRWIDALFRNPDHCQQSFEAERDGRQLPPEARGERKSCPTN
jgi:hypothetical protein